jgi:hypothetical protein
MKWDDRGWGERELDSYNVEKPICKEADEDVFSTSTV